MSDPGVRTAPLASTLHAIVLAFPVALYPAALISDITYLQSSVPQWTNFSQWLIAGADVFAGVLLAWAVLALLLRRAGKGQSALYMVVVAIMFVVGVINAFQHAKDGWASVGTAGVAMSLVCSVLALAAAFMFHSRPVIREVRP